MVDFFSLLPAGLPADPTLLPTLLDLLPMGVIYYTPVVDAAGTLTDLALAYLNPAAQRMTQLPAQPGTTYRQQFPTTDANGAWDFNRRSWLGQEPGQFQFYYDQDGFDSYFRVTAQRLGEGLLVVFTDTRDEGRSQAEEALLASQAREQAALAEAERQRGELARVFELAPVAISMYQGPEHRIELANPVSCQLLNRSADELLGKPLFEALPELAGHGFEQILASVYATGQPVLVQEQPGTHVRAGQLDTLYWNLAFVPMRAPDGQIIGSLSAGLDVTEQVLSRQQVEQLNQQLAAAQAAAERERAQLQALIAQAPVAIALFEGEDLRVASANTIISALWSHTPEQVLGRPLLEAVPELQGQGFDDLLRQVLHTQVPFTGTEIPATLRRDGQLRTAYFNFVYQPLYEAGGQVAGVLCVAVDVTEQVLARQQVQNLNEELAAINEELRASNEEYLLANTALSESQQQLHQFNQELGARVQGRTRELQNMFAQAPMALVVLRGPRFLIEQANAQAGIIWGVAVADVLGRPHFEAIPGSAGQGFEQMLTGVLATGEAVVLHEVPIELVRDHTGQPNVGYYNVVFKPLFDEGRPLATGIVVMWNETTDQVLARQQVQALNEELATINEELTATNEELHKSNTQLTRTNVDLDNFIYTASHDLKAPITNIEGLLLALEHELPATARTNDVPEMLTMMQEAIDRFRRTIDHLTDLSRLQKEHNPERDTVALAPVVEAVRLDLTQLLNQTQGQLTVSIPAGLTITFAEKNLRSVVYNLLSNAFKYRHPDRRPEVMLRSWPTDRHIVLEVQDNGLGLDLTQGQEQLFAMFQRLHTHVEGTGVGLYMVKRIIENAGGHIEVTSQLGQGSMFRVYFPL